MLSNKGKYGLKAMTHLVGVTQPMLADDIAKDNAIPRKFLDVILMELKRAGLVSGKKGRGGGYMLARPADRITVGQVIRILEGSFAPIGCTSRTAYVPCHDCPDEAACRIRDLMMDVRDQMAMVLDNTTIQALAARQTRAQREF
ncbi:MAG TPA: Rrf2 family transcriptional regulator [Novosphingobium capsulatum]|jgi:Rrf2 family protein|nr:Rrf2 family transcriptional regulator [Novosphingobium aromaticivorans]HIQ16389.1 Rrf2 family transcriptional regulator [Novosphingobium capsulatum]